MSITASQASDSNPALVREFTVATFVVHQARVLLLYHRKLRMWLPPGGHIDAGELPDDAAVREVAEETSIDCELVGDSTISVESPRQLVRPAGIQLEDIGPGHQHIDLVYFARLRPGGRSTPISNGECERADWYSLEELPAIGANDEIQQWSRLAVRAVSTGSARPVA